MYAITKRLEKAKSLGQRLQRDWRKYVHSPLISYNYLEWSQDRSQIHSNSKDNLGKFIGNADQFIRMRYTGWYCDHHQDELCYGGVTKLRTPKGTLYIAVTWFKDQDSTIFHMDCAQMVSKGSAQDQHEQAIKEVAVWSDGCAEKIAEQEREGNLEYLADNAVYELSQDIKLNREKIRSLLGAIRVSANIEPTICQHLRDSIAKIRQDCRRSSDRIRQIKRDPYVLVS